MTIKDQISSCCGAWIIDADADGHGKCAECGENCTPVYESDLDNALYEIFSRPSLPSGIRVYKMRWENGELTWPENATAICRIIRENSDFEIEPSLVPKHSQR